MTSIKEGSNSEHRIIKAKIFPQETIRKLGSSEKVNENSKVIHEETVWQEKAEFARIETRRQHVAKSSKLLWLKAQRVKQ